MSDTQVIKINGLDECVSFVKKLPDKAADEAKVVYADIALQLQKLMVLRTSGSALKARTGELKRSFKTRSYGSKIDDIGAETYTTSQYADIHETGGEIKAKRAFSGLQGGPYLTIPATGNQTAAGVMRDSARELFNKGAYTVKLKSSGKSRYAIFLGSTPMMWLVKSVKIKARLGFQDQADQIVPTLLSQLKDMKLE